MEKKTPFLAAGQWYKGNLHAHTNISDGTLTPAQLAAKYKAEGYDFLAITDHRSYGVHAELNTSDFLLLPGVELDVAPAGTESLCHHVVGIALPGKNKFGHGEKITYAPNTNVRQITALLQAQGNLCIYAHASWSHLEQEALLDVPGLHAMEIYNHTCEIGYSSGDASAWYDRLLWSGQKIWQMACDDTHQRRPDLFGGFIVVKAKDLTHASIVESILAGSFYSSQGPQVQDFYVEGDQVQVSCSECSHIGLKTDSHPGMAVSDVNGLTKASFTLRGTEKYVYLRLKDKAGRQAWTQPIFLT